MTIPSVAEDAFAAFLWALVVGGAAGGLAAWGLARHAGVPSLRARHPLLVAAAGAVLNVAVLLSLVVAWFAIDDPGLVVGPLVVVAAVARLGVARFPDGPGIRRWFAFAFGWCFVLAPAATAPAYWLLLRVA